MSGLGDVLDNLELYLEDLKKDQLEPDNEPSLAVDLPGLIEGDEADIERATRVLARLRDETDRLEGLRVRIAGEITDIRGRSRFTFHAPRHLDTTA